MRNDERRVAHTRATSGLERRGKPIVLPIIALLIALVGYGNADRQDANFPRAGIGNEQPGPAVSAPYHGTTGKGDYFRCVRPAELRPEHPAYKRLLEACVTIPLPNTL